MQELSTGGQDLRQGEHLRNLPPHDGAGHRPRLDEPQREGGRGPGGAEAAVGEHHPHNPDLEVPRLGDPVSRLNQVRHGIIQMSDASDGNYASIYKDIQILSMPYLFPTRRPPGSCWTGRSAPRWPRTSAKKRGIRVLGWWESGGFKHYSANRAIRTPDDMKGPKIRVMALIFGILVLTLGGSATPIAFPELYTSLKTGVVDGQDNAVCVFNLIKLHEAQEYLMLDGHIYTFGPLGIDDAWFSALSDELRAVVVEAGKKAIAYNRRESRAAEAKNIEMAKERA